MQRPDTIDGLFHPGNPLTGEKGTPATTDWLNALLTIATFFRGNTEPPASVLGDDGDFYICTPTRNFYGPKTAGAWGEAWTQGLAGPRGYRWYWGAGSPGVITDALDGDFYISIDSAEVWSRVGGAWVLAGTLRATPILSGNRDPLVGDGVNGDWWINYATLTIYGPKAGGAWGAGQALRGPQGIQGAAGSATAAFWADVLTINTSMALSGYDVVYLGDTTAGQLVWTLPTAIGKKGRVLALKNSTGNQFLSVVGIAGQTIDGDAQIDLAVGDKMTICSDGANWQTI